MGSGQRLSLTHVVGKHTAFSVLLSSLLSRYYQCRCCFNFWLVIICVWQETLVFIRGLTLRQPANPEFTSKEKTILQRFFSGCHFQIFFILKIKRCFLLKELICSKCQCSLHARSVFLQVWTRGQVNVKNVNSQALAHPYRIRISGGVVLKNLYF